MDARELKRRYMERWRVSSARERFVLAFLNVYLPQGFGARFVGLGAGSSRLLDGWYRGLLDAYDIIVMFHGRPAAFVEVTGVSSPREALPGLGYCVGTWKLSKAPESIRPAIWFAFVIDDEPTILWMSAFRLVSLEKLGLARRARLHEDEREVVCASRARWKRFGVFKHWLAEHGVHFARLIEEHLAGVVKGG